MSTCIQAKSALLGRDFVEEVEVGLLRFDVGFGWPPSGLKSARRGLIYLRLGQLAAQPRALSSRAACRRLSASCALRS